MTATAPRPLTCWMRATHPLPSNPAPSTYPGPGSAGTVHKTAFPSLLAEDLRNLLLDWPRWFSRRLSGWL
jgi:hypothetical protein